MDIIFKRRSIRQFTDKKIPETVVTEIIKAGMSAPSANNQQTWEFIIIDDEEAKQKISKIHPYFFTVKEAAISILVCGNLNLEKSPDYWVQDCAAATENMLLAITANNLGGVWIGVYPREDKVKGLKHFFKLNDKIIPFSLIALGYPDETKEPHTDFDYKRIHLNKW